MAKWFCDGQLSNCENYAEMLRSDWLFLASTGNMVDTRFGLVSNFYYRSVPSWLVIYFSDWILVRLGDWLPRALVTAELTTGVKVGVGLGWIGRISTVLWT